MNRISNSPFINNDELYQEWDDNLVFLVAGTLKDHCDKLSMLLCSCSIWPSTNIQCIGIWEFRSALWLAETHELHGASNHNTRSSIANHISAYVTGIQDTHGGSQGNHSEINCTCFEKLLNSKFMRGSILYGIVGYGKITMFMGMYIRLKMSSTQPCRILNLTCIN